MLRPCSLRLSGLRLDPGAGELVREGGGDSGSSEGIWVERVPRICGSMDLGLIGVSSARSTDLETLQELCASVSSVGRIDEMRTGTRWGRERGELTGALTCGTTRTTPKTSGGWRDA